MNFSASWLVGLCWWACAWSLAVGLVCCTAVQCKVGSGSALCMAHGAVGNTQPSL